MNVIIKRISAKEAVLIPLSDLHVGHVDFQEQYLRDTVAWMIKKGAYTILLGDLIDGISKKDRRFENDSIDSRFRDHLDNLHHMQVEHCVALLQPLRDAGLIIGGLTGNHETTVKKQFSYDATDIIMKTLDVPRLTDPGIVVLVMEDNGSILSAKIFCTHGCFLGGRFIGNHINKMVALKGDFCADIYVAGHTHQKFSVVRHKKKLSKNFILETKKTFFGNSGCFLGTYQEKDTDTWASRLCFSPEEPGVLRYDFYIKAKNGKRYLDIHGRV